MQSLLAIKRLVSIIANTNIYAELAIDGLAIALIMVQDGS